jgi:hypothetical protein
MIFTGTNLGEVVATFKNFPELVAALAEPTRLSITRAQYHALPKKEQGAAKKTKFVVPAAFRASPSPRRGEHASHASLVALDVDDPKQADDLLAQKWVGLQGFSFAVWHTASSTADSPRLRVLVAADRLPLTLYSAAVAHIAKLLGLDSVNSESQVPVQPMYWPTIFAGEEPGELVSSVEGLPLMSADIDPDADAGTTPVQHVSEPTGFEHLRQRVEGVELDDAREALTFLDPDCTMQEWIETAMGLKHQFGEEGYTLWDEWSAKGSKYEDAEETAYRWSTLKENPNRTPLTLRSVLRRASVAGWSSTKLAERASKEVQDWLASNPSTEELIDKGTALVAKAGAALGSLEKKLLVGKLRSELGKRGMPISVTDLKREIAKHEPGADERPKWADGLVFVTSENVFYHLNTGRKFSPEVFNTLYTAPETGETSYKATDFAVKVLSVPAVEGLRYEPKRKRHFQEEGIPYVNVYRPSHLKVDDSRADEAGEVWSRHFENLFAESDYRDILQSFFAFQVQQPGEKVNWAPLIQSAQGAGKSFLAAAMSAVLGRRNVTKVSAQLVMEDKYTAWAYGQQLVVMEEVRIIGSNRHAVMDKLKPFITDELVSVRRMREDSVMVPNNANYLMFTNYQDALAITDSDRRYFVVQSKLQTPDAVSRMGGEKYFTKLFSMLSQNAGGLLSYLRNYKLSPLFSPKGRAVITPYLREFAINAASPLQASVSQAIADTPGPLVQPDILSMSCLRAAMDSTNLPKFTDQALAAVLRELGWTKIARTRIDGDYHQLWGNCASVDAVEIAHQRATLL